MCSSELILNQYQSFLREYAELGHMELVASKNLAVHPSFYLPHHGVCQQYGSSIKLRVVFNGSCKTSNGTSLNDILYSGEKLQNDLVEVLLWFRTFRYVFSTDIEKMYRQVVVDSADRGFQRILWKNDRGILQTFELITVTYGLNCAPFLALRTLNQLIDDEGHRFPLAIPSMTTGRYVDDIFGGGDSVDEAQLVAHQVNSLCSAGKFPLHKWASNHPSVLKDLPKEQLLSQYTLHIDNSLSVSTLGLQWQPSKDNFHFSISEISNAPPPKRSILSLIARLFDPLGLVAPVILHAKIILQEVWTTGVNWDDALPLTIVKRWQDFVAHLSDLSALYVPRWVGLSAAVYVRIMLPDNISCSLLCAKTKVAPLKRQTIPRLELAAAVMLSRLIAVVVNTLKLSDTSVYLWTDSSIVHT